MGITDRYINPKAIKHVVLSVALVSAVLLAVMKYDDPFRISILLPLTYLAAASLWINPQHIRGIGCIFLFGMYCFRMCVLPVICAWGNFYLEPERHVYIDYFWAAIILMCIECVIVLGALRYYSRLYSRRADKFRIYSQGDTHGNNMLFMFAKALFVMYLALFIAHPNFLTDHYRFLIVDSIDEMLEGDKAMSFLYSYGKLYYLLSIMDSVARPAMIYIFVGWLLKKSRAGIIFSVLIGVIIMLWVTDRRILSFLTGVICFIQILLHIKSRKVKFIVYSSIASLALMTIAYCFYALPNPEMYARTFTRYFSGPQLTAINITVYMNFIQTPLDFLRRLFNDFQILTGLFGSMKGIYLAGIVSNGVRSLWTPAIIGAVQYFHVFGFIMLIPPVKFLVYADYVSMHSRSDAEKMMMNYLTVSLSVYMVMYTLELIYYHIIARGGFFFLLLWLNRHFEIVNYSRIKFFGRCRYKYEQ